MAASNNTFVQVAALAKEDMGILMNMFPTIKYSNKMFEDFPKKVVNNLGDTVLIEKPFRMNVYDGIPANFTNSSITVRQLPLTVNQSANTAWSVSSEQFALYPIDSYREGIGKANMASMATKIERYLLNNFLTNTFRFWAKVNRSTPSAPVVQAPSSYQELAELYVRMCNFGIPPDPRMRVILSNDCQPSIVGSGLQQFAPSRNDDIARSYDVGNFSNMMFHISNLLPTFTAGTLCDTGAPTTVVSIGGTNGTTLNLHTTNGVTLVAGDKLTLSGGGLKFLTFTGYVTSVEAVQVKVVTGGTADSSGNLSVTIATTDGVGLIYDATGVNTERNINIDINAAITGGATINVYGLPSRRVGGLWTADTLYFASPRLSNLEPFPTATITDSKSGLSVRSMYGCIDTTNKIMGFTTDIYYGSTLVPEYAMEVAFPLATQVGGYF